MKAHGAEELIDLCVLRDRDNTGEFSEEADGDLETRLYYCQNWRADVVATIGPDDDATGNGLRVHERVKYDSYGRPRLYPIADYDHDGDVDGSDYSAFMAEHGGAGSAQADINFDSGVDTDDAAIYDDVYGSGTETDNRKLYAGYEWDPVGAAGTAEAGWYHVRHRVLLPELGRWSRRDPQGFGDGMNFMAYVSSIPLTRFDPFGLVSYSCLHSPWRAPMQSSAAQECCDTACARRSLLGANICVDGASHCCICDDNIRDNLQIPLGHFVEPAIWSCVMIHENQHQLDIDCSLRPSGCTIPRPAGAPDGLPFIRQPGDASECTAYRAERACAEQIECPNSDIDCEFAKSSFLDHIDRKIAEYCHDYFIPRGPRGSNPIRLTPRNPRPIPIDPATLPSGPLPAGLRPR